MRMRLFLAVLTGLVLVAGSAAAATHSIPVKGDTSELALVQEDATAMRYHVEVGEIQAIDVTTPAGEFSRLLIPGFHQSQQVGAPELPMMNRLVAMPFGAQARVEVANVRTRTVKLADFGITGEIFPHQPSLSKSQRPEDVPFAYDRATYGVAKVAQPLARVEYQGRLRAMDFGRLEISPVRYLPQSGELEIVESVDVRVVFEGADLAVTEDLYRRTRSPFFEHLYAQVDGAKGFHDDYPDRVGDVVTMVIVTPPEFEAMLQDFIQWKTERGFHMITGVIGSPEVGSTTSSIQSYLHGLYENATPELPAPSFVLFVGDVEQCPTFQLSGDASDRPYCAVDADLVPDMYYGRFSATNPTQLQAILDKTMMYDTYSMPDPSYLEEVVMIAGVDSYWAPTHANGQINYGTDTYFNAAHNIYSHTYLYPESGSSDAQIIQDVSNGVSYVNYTAHGSQTSWADPTFTQADINGLQNDGKYCLAVGNCCLTSTYDYGECFAETFLRVPNKGAIGYIGGSNSTYWDEDFWWGVGYTANITANPTFEGTEMGAYDGLFHDHGEAEHLWYVTNDALIFSGNLAVMESGSARIQYYWNIYNLMGDPSISTWVGTPQINPVTYPETVFVGTPAMTVNADPGTYVGLTQDGVLVGSGTVGTGGAVEITYSQVLTPGVPLKIVAMAQFREPVIDEINVIVPATVTIDPLTIPANVPTQVTVTVMDASGVIPQVGIDVWAEGLEYATAPVATNASGIAVITVDYPFGPTVDIVGQDPDETYRLFTEPIDVTAQALTSPDLTVTTDIGLDDAFPLNLPGTLHASVGQAGYTLYAQMPDGTVQSSATSQLTVTAGELGQVTGIIALSGYDLYTETFDVIEAYGTVAGTVTSGGSPMAGVTVNCLDGMGDEVFSVVTGADGGYTAPEEILVDDYTLVVDHFGYLHFEQGVFVNYGANTFDIDLTPAPSGVLSGHVYEADTMIPLEASVKVYRSDNGELYAETTCDAQGAYTTSVLPYFDYTVRVRAWHHVPVTATITIEQPETVKDWVLEPTAGDLLLIDDGAKGGDVADKVTKVDGVLASGYHQDAGKSAAELSADLEELGYFVSVESIDTVDPAAFADYDMIVMSCGGNTNTLQNAAVKSGLVQFAQQGGHLLLEGGEVGYDQYGDDAFASWVMHSNDWNADSAGNIQIPAGTHRVATYPNDLTGTTISVTYSGYGDSDAMAPMSDATAVGIWTEHTSDASVIAFDPNPYPEGGQIVFFCFNYAAAGAERVQLLENAVLWLMAVEVGPCSVSGTALLEGETDHSGITIRAIPNGGSTTTAADGSYTLDGLFWGDFTIVASKDGWSTEADEVTLVEGQHLTGCDFQLQPMVTEEFCDQPNHPIQDNQSFDVTMDVTAPAEATISDIAVYLDITHTYIGDLGVSLTSPDGTAIALHSHSGGSAENIVGWYPTTLTPAGDLMQFIGDAVAGTWTLHVEDTAGGDTGSLNEWCLRLSYGAGGVTAVGDLPQVVALETNYPNPFNPQTTIRFAVPRTGDVRLDVFDLRGRLVTTLVDEQMQAGRHEAVWTGKDTSGRQVASGTYVYRLTADGQTLTHKMLLVK